MCRAVGTYGVLVVIYIKGTRDPPSLQHLNTLSRLLVRPNSLLQIRYSIVEDITKGNIQW